jgi:hypothetical protein
VTVGEGDDKGLRGLKGSAIGTPGIGNRRMKKLEIDPNSIEAIQRSCYRPISDGTPT